MLKTATAHDLLISQEENEKISRPVDCEPKEIDCKPKAIKGILIAIPISIALWCIIFSLAIVIF